MLRRLRTLLVAWYAGLLLVCVLGFGAAGLGLLHLALQSDLDTVLISSAKLASLSWQEDAPGPAASAALRRAVVDELREITRSQGLTALRIDSPGVPRIEIGPRLGAHPNGFYDLKLDDTPVRVLTTTLGNGTLTLAISSQRAQRLVGQGWLGLALMSPLVLIVAIAGGALLAGRAIEPAQDAIDRLKRFTQDVSHELRTPLATLSAEIDVALAKPAPDVKDLRERLVRIGRTTDRMTRLVGDLLVWVRQDSKSLRVRAEPIDAGKLLADVACDLALIHPDVEFSVEAPPNLGVLGDPFYLVQALGNLADNAAHHSPPGRPVRLTASPLGGRVRLEVHDFGAGIPPEQLERLFSRFARAESRPGAGLGLAISQAIAQAHGASIAVESRGGEGTRFWFDLPGS